MSDLFDSQRRRRILGAERGRGGEGIVYEVQGDPSLLAKIYTTGPRTSHAEKLALMHANPPKEPMQGAGHASLAWPCDLLFGERSDFVGYLMPFVRDAVPLLEVFNPHCRAKLEPDFKKSWADFNWKYLHRTARNLAMALQAVHEKGYVVGDLNESNVLVNAAALVTIIDADSFQIRQQHDAKITFFACPVGRSEYTPPELQGQSFPNVVRQPEHDLFGLAVLIFQLLMEGSHPFRCRWLGTGDPPPLEQRISRGWFPYAKLPVDSIAPPKMQPSLDILQPDVAALMQRCFEAGHKDARQRPGAKEWAQVLATAEQTLVECRNRHYYSGHLQKCPECGDLPITAKRNDKLHRGSTIGAAQLRSLSTRTVVPKVAGQVRCPSCGYENVSQEIYCQQCAATLVSVRPCTQCGRDCPCGALFCPYCGGQGG